MRKNNSKKRYSIIKNILLLFFTIAVFFALLEIFVRFSDIAPYYGPLKGLFQKDDALDYKMTPDFSGKFARQEFEISISTNSQGLRDTEYPAKKEGDFRILALGDSFTWGAYGTGLNQTFVKILEKRLNAKPGSINYQVINAGVPGYGTDQEFLYLKSTGTKFNPDIVILNFFVGNDFLDNMQSHEMTVKDGFLAANNPRENMLENIRNFLTIHSHLYRLAEKGAVSIFKNYIQRHIRGKIQYDEYESKLFLKPASGEISKEFEATKGILGDMNDYLKSRNIKFIVVIIPLNYQVDGNLREIFIKNNYADEKEFDMEQPQKAVREWGMKNNVNVIDLQPELSESNDRNDLYWKLNAHFNGKGNEAAASVIYDYLTNKKIIKN